MLELSYNTAKKFVDQYYAFTHASIGGSISLSYGDGYALSWLNEQAQKHGFKTAEAMNRACKKYLKDTPEPAPAKRQKARIEVVKYMGKSGGFSSTDTERWTAEIVGVNGKRQDITDWRNEGYGYGSSKYANDDAARWAALLGLKVVFVDKTKEKKTA